MATVYRWFLGSFNGTADCGLSSSDIQNHSVVLVSVSQGEGGGREGPMSTAAPGRFLGSAHMRVENISPRRNGGGVDFRVVVDWFEPLAVWADIFIADEVPHRFLKSE